MRVSKGACVWGVIYTKTRFTNFDNREGAATLNDMKDMLASLPQYQEQREKVRGVNFGAMRRYTQFEHFSFRCT